MLEVVNLAGFINLVSEVVRETIFNKNFENSRKLWEKLKSKQWNKYKSNMIWLEGRGLFHLHVVVQEAFIYSLHPVHVEITLSLGSNKV